MSEVDGKICITYGSHTRTIIFWYVVLFHLSCTSSCLVIVANFPYIFFQVFNDVHMLMCTLGARNEDATLKLMASLRDYVRYSRQ